MQGLENFKNKLEEISKEYKRTCELLCFEEVLLDKKLFLNYSKQKQKLQPIIEKFQEYKNFQNAILELNDLKNIANQEERVFCETEILDIQQKTQKLEYEIKKLILDFNSVLEHIIIEISPSKEEVSKELFVLLIDGYANFCKNNALKCEIDKSNNNAKLDILGLNAEKYFKNEIGLHQVINLNSEGACQVFVYNVVSEEVGFDDKDISITTCRSSGAGGQHINTTDSAIKATHIKTGISAVCQDQRSQFQNKQVAIERLKEKVVNFIKTKQKSLIEKQKKEQLKQIKNGHFVKIYNLENKKIATSDKQEYLLKDFLLGKVL